jgi:hypothetical protein
MGYQHSQALLVSLFELIFGHRYKWLIVSVAVVIALAAGGYTIAAIQANTWTTVLQDFRPSCDSVGNSTWVTPMEVRSSTETKCLDQGLLIAPSYTNITAELDLDRIKGQPYHPSKLDTQVRVSFSNQQDPDTLAGLLIQRQQGQGGYKLWINSTGYWLLQNADSPSSGNATPQDGNFTIRLKVHQGKLSGWINDNKVLEYSDTLDPASGVVGLGIFAGKTNISPVLFSSFKLIT